MVTEVSGSVKKDRSTDGGSGGGAAPASRHGSSTLLLKAGGSGVETDACTDEAGGPGEGEVLPDRWALGTDPEAADPEGAAER